MSSTEATLFSKAKEKKAPPLSANALLARLRIRYPSNAYAFMTEVPNGTGANTSRHADALAMSLWPSRGLDLYGFELKSSRSDWEKELNNPAKADAIARYCDYWYLVVGREDIVRTGELPKTWGLIVPSGDKLKVVTEASRLEAQPIGRKFLAALFRAAQANLLPDAQLRALEAQASRNGYEAGRKSFEHEVNRYRETMKKFRLQTGIDFDEWNFETIKEAIGLVQANNLNAHMMRLAKIKQTAAEIIKTIEHAEAIREGGK